MEQVIVCELQGWTHWVYPFRELDLSWLMNMYMSTMRPQTVSFVKRTVLYIHFLKFLYRASAKCASNSMSVN